MMMMMSHFRHRHVQAVQIVGCVAKFSQSLNLFGQSFKIYPLIFYPNACTLMSSSLTRVCAGFSVFSLLEGSKFLRGSHLFVF